MASKASAGNGDRAAPRKPPRGRGATHVYEALRKDIRSLALEPGALLDEIEIGRRFHLSRSPVREALIRLSAEGMVRTLSHRTAVVAPFDLGTLPAYLESVELIYRLTAKLAATRRTPQALERIVEASRRYEELWKRGLFLEAAEANRDFHVAIAEATGNPLFVTWTRTLLDQGQRAVLIAFGHKREGRLPNAHVAIVKAIRQGDDQAAELAARLDARLTLDELRAWLADASADQVALP
ncbi:MAG: GntR family transcriptional regulator [Gemmatimonadales bacterium]